MIPGNPPTQQIKDLVYLAQDYVKSGKELVGGLLCCFALEIYVKGISATYFLEKSGISQLLQELETIKTEYKIDIDKIRYINRIRNKIIHIYSNKNTKSVKIGADLSEDCREIVSLASAYFLQEGDKFDDEHIADAMYRMFPGAWLKPEKSQQSPPSPPEILSEYFADLTLAQSKYMLPLAQFLQNKCLARLDGNNPRGLKFNDLSRVNRTSGYIWISAVPSGDKRRNRVYFPGLTVLFMPHEVAVYLELPGKSHPFKKFYYWEMLQKGKIKDFLANPEVKRRKFEFFHTWWYFMRQPIGTTDEYLKNPTKKRQEWQIAEKSQRILDDLEVKKDIFTQNFFLIGKGYQRDDILSSDLKYNLHDQIIADLTALYKLQKILLDAVNG